MYRIYFWLFTFLYVLTFGFLAQQGLRIFEIIDLPISMIGLAGLFGYAYGRTYLHQTFWRLYFFILVGWDLFYFSMTPHELPPSGSLTEYNITLFISCLLVAPLYMALFKYGFRAEKIWGTPRDEG